MIDLFHIKQFWRKNWVVDFILFVILIASAFLTYKTSQPCVKYDFNPFLLNLTTEIIGVWLSVRLIDRLLKKRERLENARKQIVANVRHPFNYAHRLYPRYNKRDVEYLKNEMKWWERRWIARRTVLKNRETDIVLKIQQKNYQLISGIENLVTYESRYNNWNEVVEGEKEKGLNENREFVDEVLNELSDSIEKLILTFWETDNPDKF